MAIAIASQSTIVSSNYPTGSVTLTAPTGIATGDLLLIIAAGGAVHSPTGADLQDYSANSGRASCTGFSEADFLSYDVNRNSGVGGAARINILYKIAVSADESATEYVVAHSSETTGGAAQMFRITGWGTGNPLAHGYEIHTGTNQDGSATLTWSGTMQRPAQQVMFMVMCTVGDEDFGFSYASYASTPSETWTEAGDITFNYTDYDGGALGIAYATSSATTDITAFQFAKTLDISDGGETTVYGIIQIITPINGSGTAGLHSGPDADFYANAGLSDGTGNAGLLQANANHPTQSGSEVSRSQWTAESKPSTTWTPN